MNLILVAIGGFFGSIARFYISQKLKQPQVATWIANVSGSVLLGFVAYFYSISHWSDSFWMLFGIGFSGAYTTFSTFGHETLHLLLDHQYRAAILYVVSSFVVSIGFVAIILGWMTSLS